MNKVELIDFGGGFSRQIRADLLPDNVCQEVINCEVNQSGLLECRPTFDVLSALPNFGLGMEIVAGYLWNSFYRWRGSSAAHILFVVRRDDEYFLYLYMEGNVEQIKKFSSKPKLAITDKKVYITSDEYLYYCEINKDERLVHGVYTVQQPENALSVVSKSALQSSRGANTGLPFGSLLQYCYSFVDAEGKESRPSPVTSHFSDQFLYSENPDVSERDRYLLRNVDLSFNTNPVQSIKYINIYRRHALYSESYEGFSPFYLIDRIDVRDENYSDMCQENEILLRETGYLIKGDDIVYLDNSLFISSGEKPLEFGVSGEFIQEIRINNSSGKGWVNKLFRMRIIPTEHKVIYDELVHNINQLRFIDFDMNTTLEVYRGDSFNIYLKIPYIYPNSSHSIFVLKNSPNDSWKNINALEYEPMVKNADCIMCLGSESFSDDLYDKINNDAINIKTVENNLVIPFPELENTSPRYPGTLFMTTAQDWLKCSKAGNFGYTTFQSIFGINPGHNDHGDIDPFEVRFDLNFENINFITVFDVRIYASDLKEGLELRLYGTRGSSHWDGGTKIIDIPLNDSLIGTAFLTTLTWEKIDSKINIKVYFWLNRANYILYPYVLEYTVNEVNSADILEIKCRSFASYIGNLYISIDEFIKDEGQAFLNHNHYLIAEDRYMIGGVNNKKITFHDPEVCYAPGLGMLYYSDHNMGFPALNYISTRSKILRLCQAPLFLESGYFNSLLIFYKDRIDRLVVQKDFSGVLLDKNLVSNTFNTYLASPDMLENVDGSVYFVSPEGVMRFSQEGLENLSREVVSFNTEVERIKGFATYADTDVRPDSFIQYLPDKKQIWFYFHMGFCLVYDLYRGIFYEFHFNLDMKKGFWMDKNVLFTENSMFEYDPDRELLSIGGTVKSKKFLNKAKLKKIKTKSVFHTMTVSFENKFGKKEKRFAYNDSGIYILEAGFKGDITLIFTGVDRLDRLELYFR